MATVSIIRTGAANLASVQAAFTRLSAKTKIVEAADQVAEQDRLVLPGVGSFATGIAAIRQSGWDQFLVDRYQNNQPTLAVCLGLQLLCRSSEESPGAEGLGILPTDITHFPNSVSVPQLGWNRIAEAPAPFDQQFVYFANSYCATGIEELKQAGWDVAIAKHGIDFVAGVSRGNWLACQFHPELSGSFGQSLLQQWLDGSVAANTETVMENRSC